MRIGREGIFGGCECSTSDVVVERVISMRVVRVRDGGR